MDKQSRFLLQLFFLNINIGYYYSFAKITNAAIALVLLILKTGSSKSGSESPKMQAPTPLKLFYLQYQ